MNLYYEKKQNEKYNLINCFLGDCEDNLIKVASEIVEDFDFIDIKMIVFNVARKNNIDIRNVRMLQRRL